MVRGVRESFNAYLQQKEDFAAVRFIDSSGVNQAVSQPIPAAGLRGLAVWIPPTGFATADLLLSVSHPVFAGYIRDSSGGLIRLDGLTAGSWHIAQAEAWILGASGAFQLVSVAVGFTTLVTQSSELIIARLR